MAIQRDGANGPGHAFLPPARLRMDDLPSLHVPFGTGALDHACDLGPAIVLVHRPERGFQNELLLLVSRRGRPIGAWTASGAQQHDCHEDKDQGDGQTF